MEIARRTAAIKPVLGVIPPSRRSLHNSMRCAPPCSAAIAESSESTHTSRMRSLFMMLASARNAPSGQANQITGRESSPGWNQGARGLLFVAAQKMYLSVICRTRGCQRLRIPDCIFSGRGFPDESVSIGTNEPKFPACKLPWIPPLKLECHSEKTLKISSRYWNW